MVAVEVVVAVVVVVVEVVAVVAVVVVIISVLQLDPWSCSCLPFKGAGATFAQIFGIFLGHFGHLVRILTFRPNSVPIGVPEHVATILSSLQILCFVVLNV